MRTETSSDMENGTGAEMVAVVANRSHSRTGAGRAREIIDQCVSGVFGVPPAALRHVTRGPAPAAFARQVAMYLGHVGCGLTLTETGRAFRRDRTTVAHACALIEDCRDDPLFDHTLDLLERSVRVLIEDRCIVPDRQ